MRSALRLSYRYDPSYFNPKLDRDDFGRLFLSVATAQFSGKGGFWVQWQDVVSFAESLAVYPMPQGTVISMQWGYDMHEGDDLIQKLEISPADTRGNLKVRFEIADDNHSENRVRGTFLTTYPELELFRLGIERVMKSEVEEATLTGE